VETTDRRSSARLAFQQREWQRARGFLDQARQQGEALGGEDVFMLGDCAWWLGSFREAQALYEEASRLWQEEGLPGKAAVAAFAVAGSAFMRGEGAYAVEVG
jgi:hypothetical protein